MFYNKFIKKYALKSIKYNIWIIQIFDEQNRFGDKEALDALEKAEQKKIEEQFQKEKLAAIRS